MAPGNKHNQLTMMGPTWINNKVTRKGMRVATEVCLDRGYIADAVALCSLQNRFFQRYCSYSRKQPKTGNIHIIDGKREYTWHGDVINYFACVFEAKATRADFLSTFGTGPKHVIRHSPIGSLHWCVTPRQLIKAEELPDFWGLLEESGRGLIEVKMPKINILSEQELDRIAHQLIWPMQSERR